MQRSTKVDAYSYKEDLTVTDYQPDTSFPFISLAAVGALMLLASLFVTKPSIQNMQEIPYYFRILMLK